MPVPILHTERLVLRGWRPSDREPFAALNADPEVMKHFPATLSREQSDALVESITASWEARGYGLWAVEVRANTEPIGFVGLNWPGFEPPFAPAVEIGWRLARHAWGRGYAPEGALATLEYAWTVLGLGEVQSWTATTNLSSQRVMAKIGMTHDPADDFDHPRLPVGHPLRRHVRYRINREGSTEQDVQGLAPRP